MQMTYIVIDTKTSIAARDLDRIGTFEFIKLQRIFDTDTGKNIKTNQTLTQSPCTEEYIKNYGDLEKFKSLLPYKIWGQASCLDVGQDMNLHGSSSTYSQEQALLALIPCQNTTSSNNCYAESYRNERLSELLIGIFYSSQKFNKNNYEADTIITTELDYNWPFTDSSKINNKMQITIQRDEVVLYDDLIYNPYGRPRTKPFLSQKFEVAQSSNQHFNEIVAYDIVTTGEQENQYRTNYTLLQLVGDVGAL